MRHHSYILIIRFLEQLKWVTIRYAQDTCFNYFHYLQAHTHTQKRSQTLTHKHAYTHTHTPTIQSIQYKVFSSMVDSSIHVFSSSLLKFPCDDNRILQHSYHVSYSNQLDQYLDQYRNWVGCWTQLASVTEEQLLALFNHPPQSIG